MAWPDSIDTSQDYLVWTNTISVIYLSKVAEAPPQDGPTITNVLRRAIRKGGLPGDAILLKFDRTFRMAKAVMFGIVPKAKDIIIDDQGVRWMVGDTLGSPGAVEILSFGNEYRVHCTKSMKQNSTVST